MAPSHTTRRKRQYGRWNVEQRKENSRSVWYVIHDKDNAEIGPLGSRRKGRLRAQALASALDSAGISGKYQLNRVKPPEEKTVVSSSEAETWAQWADRAHPVPSRIAGHGSPVIAGYLAGAYGLRTEKIAHELGLSDQTVSQYLSDLRAGRR